MSIRVIKEDNVSTVVVHIKANGVDYSAKFRHKPECDFHTDAVTEKVRDALDKH